MCQLCLNGIAILRLCEPISVMYPAWLSNALTLCSLKDPGEKKNVCSLMKHGANDGSLRDHWLDAQRSTRKENYITVKISMYRSLTSIVTFFIGLLTDLQSLGMVILFNSEHKHVKRWRKI